MKRTSASLDVPVERVMTRRPDTIGMERSLGDAAGLMVYGGYRHVPVVDTDGRLVGMLSERDLRARLGSEVERFADVARELLDETVESAMRPDPLKLGRRATLRDALEILVDDRVGALPVTDDADRPVGIVSYVDLLAHLGEAASAPAPEAAGRKASARVRGAPASARGKRVTSAAAARRKPRRRGQVPKA